MADTRHCFNCDGGQMRRSRRHGEAGWYCAECDTFSPDDQPPTKREQRIAWLRGKIDHYQALAAAEKDLAAHRQWLLEELDKES